MGYDRPDHHSVRRPGAKVAMKNFRKFLCILRLVFIQRLVYRVNFSLEILSGVLSSLIVVFLWMAICREKGREGGRTILLTSHNMADIEQVCERIIIINRGRIVFAGRLNELYRLQGAKKQIRITLRGEHPPRDLTGLGQIIQESGQEVWLEVEPAQAPAVAAHLVAGYPVQDISILDPPLEKLIETIYRQPGPSEAKEEK